MVPDAMTAPPGRPAAALTEAQLARLERVLGWTTPGRWFWWMSEEPPFCIDVEGKGVHPYVAEVARGGDAEFIARAHQVVPVLIAEVRRLRAALGPIAGRYPVCYDHQDNPYCAYCARYPEHDSPPHDADCPWLLAAAALATGGPRAARGEGEEGS